MEIRLKNIEVSRKGKIYKDNEGEKIKTKPQKRSQTNKKTEPPCFTTKTQKPYRNTLPHTQKEPSSYHNTNA